MKKHLFLVFALALMVPWAMRAQNCTQTVPFFEGFETTTAVTSYSTAGNVPTCWDAYSSGTSVGYSPHVVSGTGSYIYRKTGENSLVFSASTNSTNGSRKYLVLPPMNVPLSQLQLSFWMCPESVNYGSITVGYMTSDDTSTFTVISTYPTSMAIAHSGNGLQVNTGLDVELVLSSVPATATRLALRYEHSSSATTWSCCIDDVVLDYIPTCPKVDGLLAATTANNAILSWVEMGSASSWEVVVKNAAGATVDSVVTSANPYTVSSLDPNTVYTAVVRGICSATDISLPRSVTFRTQCEALVVADLPYTYGFEDATGSGATYEINQCWGRYCQGSTSNYPNPSNSYHHTGSYALYMYNTSSVKSWASLPVLDASVEISSLSVGFWAYKTSAAYGRLKVGVMTDPNDYTTFTQLGSMQVSTLNTWEYFEFPLSGYTGNGLYVAIMADSAGTNYTYVDDVTLMETPSCAYPAALTLSDIFSDGVTLTVTDPTNVGSYLLTVSGDTSYTATFSSLTYVVTGLQPNSNYMFSVAAMCSDGFVTAGAMASLHTPCLPLTMADLPYTYDFDDATGSGAAYEISGCWGRHRQGTSTLYPYSSNSYHLSGSYSLYFYCASSYFSWATLPVVDPSINISSLSVGFYLYKTSASYGRMKVGVMTDPSDASTFVPVASVQASATSTWEYFEVPLTSYTGTGRFIALRVDSTSTCISYLDDVTLMVTPSCARIEGFEVGVPTATGAPITIVDPTNTNNYVVRVTNDNFDTTFRFYATTGTMSGLASNTLYELTVYSDCGDGTTTTPRTGSFRTACLPIAFADLPWSDDFEDDVVSQTPFCWTNLAGTTNVLSAAASAHSGDKRLDFRGTTTGNIIQLPSLDEDVEWSDLHLNFWTRPESTNANCGYFLVGYYVSSIADYVVLDSINVANFSSPVAYIERDISLADVPNNASLVFCQMANASNYYWYVDDVSLYQTAGCNRAQSIALTDFASNSITVTVQDTNYVNNYIATISLGDSIVEVASFSDTSYIFENLSPNTEYVVSLVSDCDDGTYTLPLELTFTTPCLAIEADSLPWSDNFDSYVGSTSASATSRMDIPCWYFPYRSSANYPYFNNSSTYNTSGNCVYTNTNTVIALPKFETPVSGLIMSLDVRVATMGYGAEMGVLTDPSDPSTFVAALSCVPTTTGEWQTFTATFGGMDDGFLAIRTVGTVAYIDNVVVDMLPACVPPAQIELSNLDTSSVTLTITDANQANHYMLYSYDSQVEPVEIYDTTYLMTGLQPNTEYSLYVRTVCFDGNLSEDSTVVGFRTACSAIEVPFFEDFDELTSSYNSNTQGMIPCWSINKSAQASYMTAVNSGSYMWDSGTLKFYPGDASARTIIILPYFTMPISDLELTFQTRPEGTSSSSGSFDVGYIADASDATTFVTLQHYDYSDFSGAFQLKAVRFPSDVPAGSRIAMRHNAAASNWFWFVDDVSVAIAPPCAQPQSVSVTDITVNSVTVHVSDTNEHNNYICIFDNGTSLDTAYIYNDSVLTVSTLSPSSTYNLKVKSVCTDGSITSYVETNFNTLCGAISLPVFYDMEGYATGTTATLPNCWNRLNNATVATNYYPYVYNSTSNAHSGSNILYYYFTTTSGYATKEMMVFPEIDTVNFPMNQIEVSFWAKSSSYGNRPVVVGILSDPTDTNTFQPIDTVRLTTTFEQYFVETGAFTGHGAYIALMAYKDTSAYFYVYIDDIGIEVGSPCARSRELTASNSTATTVDIAWTDVVDNYTSWKIRYAQDTLNTWTEVTANSNPFTLTGLTANTIYRAVVAPVCPDGGVAFFSRDTVRFATSQVPATVPYSYDFENASEWTNWQTLSNTTANWYRGNVAVGNTGNAMYLSTDGGITNSWTPMAVTNVVAYRDLVFDTVERNYVVNFRLNAGGVLDGNYDGIHVMLVDPAEIPVVSNTALESPWGHIGTVHARLDTTWGNHYVLFDGVSGMKRLVFYWFQSNTTSHPMSNVPPAIDDIEVVLQECERPYELAFDNVTPNAITFHWTGDAAATYIVDYRPTGTTGTDLFDTVVGTSHTISVLQANTSYSIWVRKVCSDSLVSYWSNSLTVKTLCGIMALPFTEDFESVAGSTYNTAGVLPDCWEGYSDITNANYFPHVTGSGSYNYPHSGSKVLTMTAGSSTYGSTKIVAIPPVNAPINTVSMSFWYRTESATAGVLTVGYITDLSDLVGSYVPVDTIPNTTTIVQDTVTFETVPANALQIAFRWTHTSSYYSVGIDDISVWTSGSQVCNAPLFTEVTPDETSIAAHWSDRGANSYEVAVVAGEWSDSLEVTPTIVTDTFYTFTGLTGSTVYTIGVRSACYGTIYSEWATTTITTDAHPCYAPTGVAATNITMDGATIAWTPAEEGQTNFELRYSTAGDTTVVSVTENPYTLTGLLNATEYSVAVRAICGEGNYSDWSTPATFTTASCQMVQGVNVPAATITTSSAVVNWTANGSSSYEVGYGPLGTTTDNCTRRTTTTNSYTITGLEEGTNYVVYVRSICGDGIYSDWTAGFNFMTTEVGIDDVDNTAISLYPNPASSTVTLTGIEGEATVTVVDMNGRVVKVIGYGLEVIDNSLTIDISDLSQGAYFVRITGERVNAIRKLIVR